MTVRLIPDELHTGIIHGCVLMPHVRIDVQDDDIILRGEPYRELIIVTAGKGRSIPEVDSADSPRAGMTPSRVKDLDAVIEYGEGSFFGELVRTRDY